LNDEVKDDLVTDSEQQRIHHRHAFIPFSDGIRSCLGRKFAEVEFVCTITMIVQNYTIHVPDNVDRDKLLDCYTVITLKPKKPYNLIFKKRQML